MIFFRRHFYFRCLLVKKKNTLPHVYRTCTQVRLCGGLTSRADVWYLGAVSLWGNENVLGDWTPVVRAHVAGLDEVATILRPGKSRIVPHSRPVTIFLFSFWNKKNIFPFSFWFSKNSSTLYRNPNFWRELYGIVGRSKKEWGSEHSANVGGDIGVSSSAASWRLWHRACRLQVVGPKVFKACAESHMTSRAFCQSRIGRLQHASVLAFGSNH